jgi:hypothetical protein
MNFLDHLEGFITGNLKVIKTFLSLIKLEARLAGLSIFPLLLNLCMLLIIFMSVWIAAMVLLGYCIFIWGESPLGAMASVLGINIALLLSLMKYLSFNLRKMSFEKTRQCFSQNKRINYELTKTTNERDYPPEHPTNESTESGANS